MGRPRLKTPKAKLSTTIPVSLERKLRRLAKVSRRSLSDVTGQVIEVGLRVLAGPL